MLKEKALDVPTPFPFMFTVLSAEFLHLIRNMKTDDISFIGRKV